MADNETIRLLIGDRKKVAEREVIFSNYDGIRLIFQLDMFPIASSTANVGPTGSVAFFQDGVEITESGTTTFGGDIGRVVLASALAAGKEITVNYTYYALASGEIDDLLSGYTGYPYLVAANACLVLAADAAKLFAYTMGDRSVDKRKTTDNLLKTSARYEEKHYRLLSDSIYSADQWTMKDNTNSVYFDYDTGV